MGLKPRANRTIRLRPRLVPPPLWGKNLRIHLGNRWPSTVRDPIREAAGWRCEICRSLGNDSPRNWKVCCDEDWIYDDKAGTAKLVGLQCVCWKCSGIIHLGRTYADSTPDQLAEFVSHALKVNQITEAAWERVVADERAVWEKRSMVETWEISWDNWQDILRKKCGDG